MYKLKKVLSLVIFLLNANVGVSQSIESKAMDYYSKFEYFSNKYQNDSAGIYIVKRADLDTVNFTWQTEAALFLEEYLPGYLSKCCNTNALQLYERALSSAIVQYGETSDSVVVSYNNIASYYYDIYEFEKSLEYYNKALIVLEENYNNDNFCLAETYREIGNILYVQSKYAESIEYCQKALNVNVEDNDERKHLFADCYNIMKNIYYEQGKFDLSKEYHEKELEKLIDMQNRHEICISSAYWDLSMFPPDKDYEQKALDILLTEYKNGNHNSAGYLGYIYESLGKNIKSKKYYRKYIECLKERYGENHIKVAYAYLNSNVKVKFDTDKVIWDILDNNEGKIYTLLESLKSNFYSGDEYLYGINDVYSSSFTMADYIYEWCSNYNYYDYYYDYDYKWNHYLIDIYDYIYGYNFYDIYNNYKNDDVNVNVHYVSALVLAILGNWKEYESFVGTLIDKIDCGIPEINDNCRVELYINFANTLFRFANKNNDEYWEEDWDSVEIYDKSIKYVNKAKELCLEIGNKQIKGYNKIIKIINKKKKQLI